MTNSRSLSQRDYPSDRESILKIEENRLQLVLNRVEEQIEQLRNSMPYPGICMYSTGVDREDISNLQFQKEENFYTYEQIAKMESYRDQPYFARMDFVLEDGNTHDTEVIYIGKKTLYLDGEFLIYDWRKVLHKK